MNENTHSNNREQIQFGQSKKSRKGLKVLLTIVLVALVAAGVGYGVYAWQQQEVNKLNTKVDTLNKENKMLSKANSKVESEEFASPNEGYLVLEDWGIRLKLPEGRDDISYYKHKSYDKRNDVIYENYEFTTERVENLKERCVETNESTATRMAKLSRAKIKPKELLSAGLVNDGKPINGYYYIYAPGQSLCAEKGLSIQTEDAKLIREMVSNLEPANVE